MSSDRGSQKAGNSESIQTVADAWHDMYGVLEDVKKSEHPGASYLLFCRQMMMGSFATLLELGLDVSAPFNPRVIPVSAACGPKTRAEGRRWEAEIAFQSRQYMASFSAVCAGTHVIRSAVGDVGLAEFLVCGGLAPVGLSLFGENSAASSPVQRLDGWGLICSLWLLEPTGEMKTSAADLEAECCKRMLYALEINPLTDLYRRVKDNELSAAERLAALNTAAGWSRANIKPQGNVGTKLRAALGAGVSDDVLEERLLEELPNASLIAWEDREPGEPLKSTGHREKNLARRVAASIEGLGNEDATRPGKLVHDIFGMQGREAGGQVVEALGEHDHLLDEFELHETAQQELNQLKVWAGKAKLSEQERQVYGLDMQTDHDTAAIAQELGKSREQIRQVRKRYTDKFRKAAGA